MNEKMSFPGNMDPDKIADVVIAQIRKDRKNVNDASGGTHADTEALESQRKTDAFPGEPTTGADPSEPIDIDPNAEVIENIDESVKRAGW